MSIKYKKKNCKNLGMIFKKIKKSVFIIITYKYELMTFDVSFLMS